LTIPLIPVAAMIAIVRHQLYDIHVVINRTFVYGLLTLGIVASYFAVVALIGQLAHDNLDTNPLIATVLIALAFAPGRQRLQKAVDRLMYGESRDPATTVAHVGAHLTADLDGVLRAVCAAMRLPYAAISSDGKLLASVGDEPQVLHSLGLDLGADAPAELLVGLRRGESDLSDPDRRTLETLSGPLSIAVRSVRLSSELSESRARIVAAREDERRRLRRDLHDGLGTSLTAIRLKADAASNLQSTDPERAAALLVDLRGDLSEAIADVRRLVYGLRPPALDDLGLLGALRQQAEQSWRRERAPFVVTIDAPEVIPPLSAAVEVAAYRIATESVTNTLRHGDATTCRISLRFDDALHLEVQDNGPCQQQQWRLGVGLTSMRERAAELGGRVTAGPTDHGGRVHALLPLEGR
jgi:signal transduction histidine kinase